MLDEINILYLLAPALVIAAILSTLGKRRVRKETDPLKKSLLLLKWQLTCVGVICLALWLALPSTAVSSTFGYPHSIESIKTPELLLDYLQQANKDLVRTRQVLHFFLFLFIFGFLSAFHTLLKSVSQAMAERDGNPY